MYTDISYLQQITKNNYDVIRLTIDKFTVSIPEVTTKLERFLKEQDYDALGAEAHKLLSTIGILRIKQMDGLVRELEMNCKERQNLGKVPAMVGEVNKISEYVMVELKELKQDLEKDKKAVK
jgi:HPt (histidine-containing phosphotransfer) domain-containing protein